MLVFGDFLPNTTVHITYPLAHQRTLIYWWVLKKTEAGHYTYIVYFYFFNYLHVTRSIFLRKKCGETQNLGPFIQTLGRMKMCGHHQQYWSGNWAVREKGSRQYFRIAGLTSVHSLPYHTHAIEGTWKHSHVAKFMHYVLHFGKKFIVPKQLPWLGLDSTWYKYSRNQSASQPAQRQTKIWKASETINQVHGGTTPWDFHARQCTQWPCCLHASKEPATNFCVAQLLVTRFSLESV